MNFKLFFLVALLASLGSVETYAQWKPFQYRDRLGDTLVLKDISEKQKKPKSPKVISSEFSLGPVLLTDGYGLQFNYGRYFGSETFGAKNMEMYHHTHVFQLTITERFHRKEYRNLLGTGLRNTFSGNMGDIIVYGKVNNFYNANLSYGQRRLFGGRGESGAVLIQFFYGAGLNVGLIKPYYIETSAGLIKYSDSVKQYFLDQAQITGIGGYSTGWSELEMNFGISARTGMHFDFSKKRKNKSAVEVGVGVDYYFKKVHQMVENEPKAFFTNIYFTYQFGKKW